VARRELLAAAQGRNQRRRPEQGTGARDWGFFSPDVRARPQRERWRPTSGPQWLTGPTKQWHTEGKPAERVLDTGRVRVNGSGPIEIRNGFLNLDKGFPILQNRK
jgi:hypothetical protein